MKRLSPLMALGLIFALTVFSASGALASPGAPAQLPSFGAPQLATHALPRPAAANTGTSAPTRIAIPAIGVNTSVVNLPLTSISWDVSRLTWQVGHLEGTAYPGQGSNVVLGGHRYLGIYNANPSLPGPFAALDKLQPGDLIQVYAGSNVYTYQVTEHFLVTAMDVWVVQPTGNDILTLMTCSTWNPQTMTFSQRLVVRAGLVEVQPIGGAV